MTLNIEWHLRNRMPCKPTPEQRKKWHEEHQKNCSCRDIPASLSSGTKPKKSA